jgi:hypothetical protein
MLRSLAFSFLEIAASTGAATNAQAASVTPAHSAMRTTFRLDLKRTETLTRGA